MLGLDYIEKKELRAFLVSLRIRLELLHGFEKNGEDFIELTEFMFKKAMLEEWSGKIVVPLKEYTNIAKKHGKVTLNDVCDWAS